MRSNEVFARVSKEGAASFLAELREHSPATATVALGAAAAAFKLRPQFLKKQSRERQADWARRALARPGSAEIAEEVLAGYFLDVRGELLVELLDGLGVEHDEGRLQQPEPPQPDAKKLGEAVGAFREGEDAAVRELLLLAFAAQSSIDWPELEALLGV